MHFAICIIRLIQQSIDNFFYAIIPGRVSSFKLIKLFTEKLGWLVKVGSIIHLNLYTFWGVSLTGLITGANLRAIGE